MNLLFWLRRPGLVVARVRYWLWERRNSDKPWLTPGAVDFCTATMNASMRGWGYGSGRSTVWFAAHLSHLVSIEHAAEWYRDVAARLAAARVTNVDYRHVPLDHPDTLAEQPVYDPMPAYVTAIASEPDESLHFVIVDGHYRSHCIRAALPKLAPGGYLLVDDLNIWTGDARLPAPEGWEQVHESSNGIKRTGVWKKPGRATVG
jgi:hypothetical protein